MLEAIKASSLYIVPVLLTAAVLLRATGTRTALNRAPVRFILLLLAVPLTLIKVGQVSIASLVLTVSPGYSVTTMGVCAVLVVSQLRRSEIMRRRDWAIPLGFNIALGGYLYLSVLGLAPYDAYPLGYGFSWIFVVTALYTIVLVLMKNPLSLAYVLAIAAWDFRLLAHSRNFFDYLIDGPLFVGSVIGMVVLAVRISRRKHTY